MAGRLCRNETVPFAACRQAQVCVPLGVRAYDPRRSTIAAILTSCGAAETMPVREARRVNTTTIKIAGVDLDVLDSGDGTAGKSKPLLFLHSGMGYDPWQSFAGELAKKRRVIAPSHPGFGKSSLPEWLDSIDDISYLYLELLDRLGVEQVDMVACSVGGWIGAETASKAPQRFRKLVLVAPVGVKLGSADKLDIPDIFAMPQTEFDKLVYKDPAKILPDFSKLPDEDLATIFRAREALALLVWEPWMHNTKLKRRVHRVTAPALFVRGDSDGLVSANYIEGYAKLLPNAQTMTISDAGHLPHLEQPQALASAIGEFLEK
jgi:pimeloyl-ACP methyl ester carboxylesterase